MIFGKHIINYLRKLQIGETVRDLGLAGQKEKQGTQLKQFQRKRLLKICLE